MAGIITEDRLRQVRALRGQESSITEDRLAQVRALIKADPGRSADVEPVEPEGSLGLGNRKNEFLESLGMAGRGVVAGVEGFSDLFGFGMGSDLAAAHSRPATEQTLAAGKGLGSLAIGGAETMVDPSGKLRNFTEAGLSNMGLGDALPSRSHREGFEQAAQTEADFAPGGPRFNEDKTRFLSSLAGILPSGPKGTMLGKVLKVGQSLDPVAGAMNIAGATAGAATKKFPAINRVAAEAIGVTTGAKGERGQALIRAGREGEGDIARQVIMETRDAEGRVIDTAFKRGEDVLRDQNKRLGELTAAKNKALDAHGDVNITALREEILGNDAGHGGLLEEFGIRVVDDVGGDLTIPAKQGSPRRTISLEVPEDFRLRDGGILEGHLRRLIKSPNDIPARDLDKIKIALSKAERSAGTEAGPVLTRIRRRVRTELAEIEDFDTKSDAIRDYFQETNAEGAARGGVEVGADKLGVQELFDRDKFNPTSRQETGGALDRSFNEGSGQKDALQALDELNEATPGIRTRSAAAGFTGFTPNEIIGRNKFFQIIGGITAVGAAGGGIATGGLASAVAGIAALPVAAVAFIPRNAGRFLIKLGESEAGAARLAKLAGEMSEQADAFGIGTQNITLGQLAARLEEERKKMQPQSLMGQIGNAVNSR